MPGPFSDRHRVGEQQTMYDTEYHAVNRSTDSIHDGAGFGQQYSSNVSSNKDISRSINRTPSPTPSEIEALDPKAGGNAWQKFRKLPPQKQIIYGVVGAILITLTILISVYTDKIVLWLQPTANKIHDLPAGFLIPVAILFVLSFPPLFGQELILAVVGLTWGFWGGIAIAAAGTYLGEVGNFFAFKLLCRSRSKALEKNIDYAVLAQVVREGGVIVPIVARYSFLPPHYTTAVFATCGLPFWVFTISAIVSLPRQFVNVFVGVVLEDKANGTETKTDKIASTLVVVVTIVVTYGAVRYMKHLTEKVKPKVIYARRKARQGTVAVTFEEAGSTETLMGSQSQENVNVQPKPAYPPQYHSAQPSFDGGYQVPAYQQQPAYDPYDSRT